MKNIDTLNTIHNFVKNHAHIDALLENLGRKQKYFWVENFCDELKKSVSISKVIDIIDRDEIMDVLRNSETINNESVSILNTLNAIPEILKIARKNRWMNQEPVEEDIVKILQAIVKYVNETGIDAEFGDAAAHQLIEKYTYMSTVKEQFKLTIAKHHMETNNIDTYTYSLDWNKNYPGFVAIFEDVVAEIQDEINTDVGYLLLDWWHDYQCCDSEDTDDEKYTDEDEYYAVHYWYALKEVCNNIDEDVIYNFILKTLTQMCKGNFENPTSDFVDIIRGGAFAARQQDYR